MRTVILLLAFILIGCSHNPQKVVVDYSKIDGTFAHAPNSEALPVEDILPCDTLKRGDTITVYHNTDWANEYILIRP
jgi:hypothetical protein